MCAFHQQRQAGILFERLGGERTSCVLFIIYNKVVPTELMLRNAIGVRFEEGWS